MAKFIDGIAIAAQIEKEIKEGVDVFRGRNNRPPCLGVILISDDPASKVYVNRKQQACERVGIRSILPTLPIDTIPSNLFICLEMLNKNPDVDGILLQLPLPPEYGDWRNYFSRISPLKDVDVFHPENVGLLVQGRPRFEPCTPQGIREMLTRSGISFKGKHVVVVNRSDVVGKPLSSMLIQDCDQWANATVTVCHDGTPHGTLKGICLSADIIVIAVGKPGFLTADMVSPSQVVVDVGTTRVGKKLVGDVAPEVYDIVQYATKVPGGVGPMTVSMLLKNTLQAAEGRFV